MSVQEAEGALAEGRAIAEASTGEAGSAAPQAAEQLAQAEASSSSGSRALGDDATPNDEKHRYAKYIARSLSLDGRWGDRLARLLTVGLLAILIVATLKLFSPVLSPLMIAWMLAWVLNPIIEGLQKRGLPRWAGIAVVGGAAVIVLAVVSILLIPVFVAELINAVGQAPAWIDRLVTGLQDRLGDRVSGVTGDLDSLMAGALSKLNDILVVGLGRMTDAFSILINVAIIPIFTVYFLIDFRGMHQKALEALPPNFREIVRARAIAMDQVVGNWLRGQIKVASVLGIVLAVVLWVIGLRMGFVIGLISGLLNVLPFVGAATGLVVSIFIALASGGGLKFTLFVAAVFIVIQLLEAYVLTPRWVGSSVGFGPVTIIVVIMVGGTLFGFFGVLLSVPITAALMVLTRDFMAIWDEFGG